MMTNAQGHAWTCRESWKGKAPLQKRYIGYLCIVHVKLHEKSEPRSQILIPQLRARFTLAMP